MWHETFCWQFFFVLVLLFKIVKRFNVPPPKKKKSRSFGNFSILFYSAGQRRALTVSDSNNYNWPLLSIPWGRKLNFIVWHLFHFGQNTCLHFLHSVFWYFLWISPQADAVHKSWCPLMCCLQFGSAVPLECLIQQAVIPDHAGSNQPTGRWRGRRGMGAPCHGSTVQFIKVQFSKV